MSKKKTDEKKSNRGCKGIDQDALILTIYMDEKLPAGLNNKDLAAYLNISEDSFYNIKKENVEFIEALDFYTGKSTVEVLKSFKKAACGFNYTETKHKLQKGKKGEYKMTLVEKIDKFIPPNVTAGFNYLKNKMSHQFKESIEQVHSIGTNIDSISFIIKGKG